MAVRLQRSCYVVHPRLARRPQYNATAFVVTLLYVELMTTLAPITRITASLWAKSPKLASEVKLGVLEHLLNVAACAAEILELEPPHVKAQMAADLGLEPEQGLNWVLALVALHDLGKASPAFQMKWPEGMKAVDGWLSVSRLLHEPYTFHGVVSEFCLPDFLVGQLRWNETLTRRVSDAVGCHHGFRVENMALQDVSPAQIGDDHWRKVRFELCRLVAVAVGADFSVVPPAKDFSAAAFMRLAGLTSFADWLGSSFPLPTQTDFSAYEDPAAYFAAARAQAKSVLTDEKTGIHWPDHSQEPPEVATLEEVFDYLVDGEFQPRPLQTALAEALAKTSGPALVLVEAPMGEGKTEAALYAYLQLARAARHRGLYIALPTQATGNAMYKRLVEFLHAQKIDRHVSIQLAHGGSLLADGYQKRRADTQVFYRQNVDADGQDSVEAVRVEEWFTSRKRALLDEYGVGTVDQALLGVLGVSHQFVRLWGLGNRVVVLDEVHAYDTYTSELIAALVAWLRALGSSVVIMSATLPDESRRRLLGEWGVGEVLEPRPYPRWTVADTLGQVQSATIPDQDEAGNVSRPTLNIALRSLPSAAEAVARQAVDLTLGGGCTAVIVNTVQRAQEVQKAAVRLLEARGITAQTCTKGSPKGNEKIGVLLYHARYPADERLYREQAVLKYLGKGGQRPERLILIATQVAEQSLDFDADVMISDLAPIDLLLQRSGRLHRHARSAESRHGHIHPVLYVAGLDEWPAAALKAEAWGRVYAPALLYQTWRVLQGRETLTLPTELDELVQVVYGAALDAVDLTDEQAQVVQSAEEALRSFQQGQASKGRFAHIGLPAEFWQTRPVHTLEEPDTESVNDDALADENDFPRTRLGEESVRIVPVKQREDGVWVVCPPPKTTQPKGEAWAELLTHHQTLEKGDMDTAKRIFRRSLSVSRWEVVGAVKEGRLWTHGLGSDKRGWAAHPLLRDAVPLDLTAGYKDLGSLRLRLDPELGLTYEKLS